MGLFITAVFIAMFGNAYQTSEEQAKQEEYATLLSVVKSEIELAYRAPVGYVRTVNLPITINRASYNLTFDQNELGVDVVGAEYVQLLPSYVLGSFAIDYDHAVDVLSDEYTLTLERTETNVYLTACPTCTPSYTICAEAEVGAACAFVDAVSCCDYHLLCCPP